MSATALICMAVAGMQLISGTPSCGTDAAECLGDEIVALQVARAPAPAPLNPRELKKCKTDCLKSPSMCVYTNGSQCAAKMMSAGGTMICPAGTKDCTQPGGVMNGDIVHFCQVGGGGNTALECSSRRRSGSYCNEKTFSPTPNFTYTVTTKEGGPLAWGAKFFLDRQTAGGRRRSGMGRVHCSFSEFISWDSKTSDTSAETQFSAHPHSPPGPNAQYGFPFQWTAGNAFVRRLDSEGDQDYSCGDLAAGGKGSGITFYFARNGQGCTKP